MGVYGNRSYDDGQILFDKTLSGFATIIRMLLKIIVYSPLLFISGLLTKQITGNNTAIILKLALVLLLAVILYYFIYFLKGILIALKYNRNLFWMPLYIVCVLITCILPVWIIFEPLQTLISRYTETNQQLITWICALAFGFYVYSKYHFLTNIASSKAFPNYQSGISVTNHFLTSLPGSKQKNPEKLFEISICQVR